MRIKDIPRIRSRRHDDGSTIAVAVRKRFRRDHLCEDLGKGFKLQNRFGVYWVRDTRRGASAALKLYREWLFDNGCRLVSEQIGDYDGILWFEATRLHQIPEWFRKPAGKVSAGKAKALAGKDHP